MSRRLAQVVLILFLTASVFAAVEVPVSDVVLRTAPGMKRLPALAAGDGGYLAVWLDQRSGDYTLTATRVAATGEPLDPLGIPLGRAAAYRQPQVLWNGDHYLVFWNAAQDSALMVTRVSPDGVAEAPRVLREHAWLDSRSRAVATNGTHIVLAYSAGPMHVVVMTPDAVVTEDRIVDARHSGSPTVLVNDRDFLVAWSVVGSGELHDFVAVRLDSRGAAIDASPRKIGEGGAADILRNGSDYVALSPASDATPSAYRSWSVSRDLMEVGAASPLPLNHYDRDPSLLDGSPAMMVIFEATNEAAFVAAVTFDENGHEAGPRKRIMESIPSHFAVSRGDYSLAIIEVKPERDSHSDELTGSLFDPITLAPKGEERALALSAGEETAPAIVGGAGRYLVVWTGPGGLTAGRFLPSGTRLDGDGFVLGQGYHAVAFDGERFVVAYARIRNNSYETIVRFISPSEGLLPEELLLDTDTISHYVSPPGLAVGAGTVLVAWMGSGGVHAAALRGTQVVAPARKIADSQGSAPAGSWNGRRFLVVWDESEFDGYDTFSIRRIQSMRLEIDLTPIDGQPRPIFERNNGPKNPVVTPWKRGWLIAFQDGYEVRLHEIDDMGAMEETPLATVAGTEPRLVKASSRPWLAWTALGADLLRVAPVLPDGTLGTNGALSIAAPAFGYSFGHSSSIGAIGNDVAAAYARVALEAGTVRRVFISLRGSSGPGRRRSVR